MKKLSIWENEKYLKEAQKGSSDVNHPAMLLLKRKSKDSKKILDLGCGDGTRLGYLCGSNNKCTGVDISISAIKKAKKKYPQIDFVNVDLEEVDLPDSSWDLVYSAYVLEHLENPEKAIKEAIRLCKKNGYILYTAPNYGSPNRASPPFIGSRIRKLIFGFYRDIYPKRNSQVSLNWNKVKPILKKGGGYKMDEDTLVEPYIDSLCRFLEANGVKIECRSSLWDKERKDAYFHQKLFSLLSFFKIWPFVNWGPHLLVFGKKL